MAKSGFFVDFNLAIPACYVWLSLFATAIND
jgi:hypothetical protein